MTASFVVGTLFSNPISLSWSVSSISQVNSDKIYWQKNADGTFTQIYSEKKIVGISISTKAVGSNECSDITHLYKHPEGSIKQKSRHLHNDLKEITKNLKRAITEILLLDNLFNYLNISCHSQAQMRNALLWKQHVALAPKQKLIHLLQLRMSL